MLACRDGENHRSLPQLLKDLNKRAEGQQPAAVALGGAVSQPMHVVLHVSSCVCKADLPVCCGNSTMLDVARTAASDTAAAADSMLCGVSFNAYYAACCRVILELS